MSALPDEVQHKLVIQELYRQQSWMYNNHSKKITDRIVSISQPHIRPIVRGKARCNVEFGAKISVSLVNGFSFVNRISWNSYNESGDLITQIKQYYNRLVFILNQFMLTRFIEHVTIGASVKNGESAYLAHLWGDLKNKQRLMLLCWKRKGKFAIRTRSTGLRYEGKFGQGKRRFTLGRIMAKLAETSEAVITISFIVMNL